MKQNRWMRAGALTLALTMTLHPLALAVSVEDARELLTQHYIDEIPDEILNLPTVDEITAALGDPFTYHMSAEEQSDFDSNLNDTQVVGIGAMVEKLSYGLRVVLFGEDSPAQDAGLQEDDLIIAVDGVTIQAAGTPNALGDLVPGEEGTSVALTVQRGDEVLEFTVIRKSVVFPIVRGEVVDDHIGWLSVTSFGENTGDYFEAYITEEAPMAQNWVIDLRGNPGGFALAVLESLGHLLGEADIAYLVNNQGSYAVWNTGGAIGATEPMTDKPIIVLVNETSASASELFAGAMRDYGAGLIIGRRTFGKGTSQSIYSSEDGSGMKITTRRYYTPAQITPDKNGILPHLVVDADLADEVAYLLSGTKVETPSADVWEIALAGDTWYVHRDKAADPAYGDAVCELMAALAPNTPMTLDGVATTPESVAQAWGIDHQSRNFTDLGENPYADQINTLAALGLLQGDEQGNFNPDNLLTRAEMATLLTQVMGFWAWDSEPDANFADLTGGEWYHGAANLSGQMGIMVGDERGNFNGGDLLDYNQFVTMLVRSAVKYDLGIQRGYTKYQKETADLSGTEHFASWAQSAAAVSMRLNNDSNPGEDGIFLTPVAQLDPTASVTRAEAVAMCYNLLVYSGVIVPVT